MIYTTDNESTERGAGQEFAHSSHELVARLKRFAEAETARRGLPAQDKFDVLMEIFEERAARLNPDEARHVSSFLDENMEGTEASDQ